MQENYNNLNWTTDTMAMAAPKEQVSASELDGLLKGRKFNRKQEDAVDMFPTMPTCDPEELRELEEYCKKRGIVGVNFNGMSPRAALNMLRGKVEGMHKSQAKKGLLYG